MTLMLALGDGAGTDAQHSTAQVTPEDAALKEESQAQKCTGSDSTYINCPKQPCQIHTDRKWIHGFHQCGMRKKTLETPNLPQGQTPFLQRTTQEMTITKEISVQCPAPLHPQETERHGWYSQGLEGLLPIDLGCVTLS